MLTRVADGVLVHESEFIQSNTTVVQGRDGVLIVDPGITLAELEDLAADLRGLGRPVVAGFSTHPDWDHLLWHPSFGEVPRYATDLGAARIQNVLSSAEWQAQVAEVLPPEHADEIPMELLGLVTGLPVGSTRLPWNGPGIRILEHRAHAAGHAALLLEDSGVLVAGDMLSDILMPFLDLQAAHPLEDYLDALRMFDEVAGGITAVVPGHGSVGGPEELRARIDRDRAYVRALLDGDSPDDYRVGPDAPLDWLADVHDWQVQRLAEAGQSAQR